MWLIASIASAATWVIDGVGITLDEALVAAAEGDVLQLTADARWSIPPPVPLTLVGSPPGVGVLLEADLTTVATLELADLTLSTGAWELVVGEGTHATFSRVDVVSAHLVADGRLDLVEGSYVASDTLKVFGELNATGTRFADNHNGYGGVVRVSTGANSTFTGCWFEGNSAELGGAIYHDGDTLVVRDSTFCANEADDGSAIWTFNKVSDIVGNAFVAHTSDFAGVLNVYVRDPSLIESNTFLASETTNGPGIGFAYGPTTFRNNLIHGVVGNGKILVGGNGATGHNLTFDAPGALERPGDGDLIDVDPLLVSPDEDCATFDLRVRAHSPAIGAGDPAVGPDIGAAGVLDLDVDSDGLLDSAEAALGTNPDVADTDDGGVVDGDEIERGTDPLDPTDDLDPGPTEATPTGTTPTGTTPTGTTPTDTLPTDDARPEAPDPRLAGAIACGCSGGPLPAWLGWGILAAVLARRER